MDWKKIETMPEELKDGRPVGLARLDDTFGWVMGWGWYEDLDPLIRGWITHGFREPPGNLGLAAPTHYAVITPPETEE